METTSPMQEQGAPTLVCWIPLEHGTEYIRNFIIIIILMKLMKERGIYAALARQ